MRIHFAHTLMLMKQGIITQGEGKQILFGLQELMRMGAKAIKIDYSLEDMYSHIEEFLISKTGMGLGGKMHTGRSRNDMAQTVWRMLLRQGLLDVLTNLLKLRGTILTLAQKHVNTVMPGYTCGQQAQPITFGYYLAALHDSLERDTLRLKAAYSCVNRCPLGACALATTGFPIDREFTAELLGFQAILTNGYDAVSSRDDAAEAMSCFTIMAINLSRLYQDLHTWCSAEYSFVEIADQYAQVSSMMPQKKNPTTLEYLRSISGYVLGDLVSLLSVQKNTTFGLVSDNGYPLTKLVLNGATNSNLALTLVEGIVASLIVKQEIMLEKTRAGLSTMTELADTIVREKNLSFRYAHSIVAKTVKQVLELGKTSAEITTDMLDSASQDVLGQPLTLDKEMLKKALDPIENVMVRNVLGGPAPKELARSIVIAKGNLRADKKFRDDSQRILKSANEQLEEEVAKALSSQPNSNDCRNITV
jgi:argininosuccinate lyase